MKRLFWGAPENCEGESSRDKPPHLLSVPHRVRSEDGKVDLCTDYIWLDKNTLDYIEFIPKISGSQEVPFFHVYNLASKSSSISNFLSNYLVAPVLLNHPAVEPVGHVEYMFSPPDNKLQIFFLF